MPYRVPTALDPSEAERAELESWARRRKTAQAIALRAHIVLQAAAGLGNTAIAAEPGIAKHTVGKWRERFVRQRTDGLLGEPRPGAPRRIKDEQIAALVDRTLAERPEGSTHWSPRMMAQLEDYLKALAYRFTPEDASLMDRLVTPGHPSTPGCNDPQYPIEGW